MALPVVTEGESPIRALTRGRLLARNVALNLLGWSVPVVLAFGTIPLLAAGLGTERYGLLNLAWTVIGYFSILDLGLSRALTHLLSQRLERASQEELGGATWTALAMMLPLGLLSALGLWWLTPWLVGGVLNIPRDLQGEALLAMRVLALALPFTVLTAGLRGVLEATQRFGAINVLRMPLAGSMFLGPLVALPLSHSLVPPVAILAATRVGLFVAHVVVCRQLFAPFRRPIRLDRSAVRPLLGFGGWITVSNVVIPILSVADRFLVGSVLTVSAVAYYSTSQEVVTKMWVFTSALLPVLFPAIAATVRRDPDRAASLFDRGARATATWLFPPTMLLVAFAGEGLRLWLGADFAANGASVLQVLAVAIYVNCIGQSAYTVVQASGRPDVSGKLHLVQLPLYLGALLWVLPRFGIVGAAVVWAARATVETVVFLVVARWLLPAAKQAVSTALFTLSLTVPALIAAGAITRPGPRVAYVAAAMPAFLLAAWNALLTEDDRAVAARLTNLLARRVPIPGLREPRGQDAT